MKSPTLLLTFFLISLTVTTSLAQQPGLPDWLLQEWQYLTAGTGTWITDNSAYKNDDEPYEAYGLQWTWGLGKKSITGKLYGIKDGKNSGTFWEFRTFWHPGEQKAYTEQFGSDGTYGIGEISLKDKQTIRMLQTFYSPDGSTYKVGHESITTASKHKTISYTVDGENKWQKNRVYVWKPFSNGHHRFGWLSGTWKRERSSEGRNLLEVWEKDDSALKGVGFSVSGKDTTIIEQLSLQKRGTDYYYIADVAENRAPVEFKITDIRERGFTAENPSHDFPQKIVYDFREGVLSAEISAGNKKIRLTFLKQY